MISRVFNFELNGRDVLGFDTGLDSQAFAQAKMAQFITQNGFIVYPDGKLETWKPGGVWERQNTEPKENNPGSSGSASSGSGSMVIWGPFFPGENLDSLLRDKRREESLNAIRYWIRAQIILENRNTPDSCFQGAMGAFIICNPGRSDFPPGTILFPPERLIRRSLEAEGEDAVNSAQQWVHPDLKKKDSIVFSAAAMAYTVFSGELPFPLKDGDTLRQDIREGVFIPPRLMAPGLDNEMADLISYALEPVSKKIEEKKRPDPETFQEKLGDINSKNIDSWFRILGEDESAKISAELEQYRKNRERSVKTRRFIIRNTTIIALCLAAVIGAALMVRGYFKHRSEMPNTRGMTPVEVVTSYYDAFGSLDHETMEACISGKEAKKDIDMVLNLYVISRVRQAYEPNVGAVSAQEWLDSGSPDTERTVFGITDLKIVSLGGDEKNGELFLEADYSLWMPSSVTADDTDMSLDELNEIDPAVILRPVDVSYRDELRLQWIKDSWRITEINRQQK